MAAELVTAIPTMGSVYARAVKTLNRKAKNPVLPEVTLIFQGARAQPEKLLEYRRELKAPANGKLPSLYVHSLAFPLAMSLMLRDDFPLPLLGMIHLSNQVQVTSPLTEDEVFDVEVNAENLVPHAKGVCCDLVVKIVVNGQTRMLLRSTFLAKGVKVDGEKPQAAEHREFVPPQRTAQWKLAGNTGRSWAAVAGDYNPIHLSALSAKALGMPRAIAHGIYLAARALNGIEPASGNYGWQIEFNTPVLLPGTVDLGFSATQTGFQVQGWNQRKLKPHFELRLERQS